MKAKLASILAFALFLASLSGAVEAYLHISATQGGDPLVVENGSVPAHTQDAKTHFNDHCGHFAQHLLGQPSLGTFKVEMTAAIEIESSSPAPHRSETDTPLRPPRTSQS